MYRYTPIDQSIVDARVEEFRDQVRRYQAGALDDATFLQLRLRNGLYKQRHAYMLRVAIPYGMLSSTQLRMLATISRKYDRGFGHITTRQNIQYNWPALEDVPDLLADLASVEMHAIQTSGNVVRNTTSDPYAGIAKDEVVDPRPYAEIIRQWSTLHPEFNFLPRKFKIAITGAETDRTALAFHDIGLRVVRADDGAVGFRFFVGGGLGRTPLVGREIHPFVPEAELLSYIEAILRVYNLEGDRENKFKARIKILVKRLGVEAFREKVDAVYRTLAGGKLTLSPDEVARFRSFFVAPDYATRLDDDVPTINDPRFAAWTARSVIPHKVPGYRAVTLALKSKGRAPGDVTADEMDAIADLADRFSFGELRTTYEQNFVLSDVEARKLPSLFSALDALGLALPNAGLLTDMICCPGIDYCNLANASSISVAKEVSDRLEGTEKLHAIGEVRLKMSGCVNACGHHHAGHIGLLGVEKNGAQAFQILLGGNAKDDAAIGKWLGPALPPEDAARAIEDVTDVYLEERDTDETFLDTLHRIGRAPFAARVYPQKDEAAK